jgi:hypothetical protein
MLHFCTTIHARPQAVAPGPLIALPDGKLPTLAVAPEVLAATTFDCTFEEASARLEALERMFLEPDGSFVWTSSQADRSWQVDGNLYDRAQRLAFVDLSGACPSAEFNRLLAALGWPQTPLVFQLTHEAVVLAEDEFRRYAAATIPPAPGRSRST